MINIKDNKGYSLVEMIIVIAMIAILSTMAVISMSIVRSAKAREAAMNFDSEIAELSTKSKNMVCMVDDGSGNIVEKEEYMHALKVYKSGRIYYIAKGFYDTSTATYIFDSTTDPNNNGKGTALSKFVMIKYTPQGSNVENDLSAAGSEVYIRIRKNGTVVEGSGTYGFYKVDGNEVSSVVLRSNGSHNNN